MEMIVRRFEIYLISLDATIGSEKKKNRFCLIVSPDEINNNLNTLIVASLTSVKKNYPTRVNCKFKNRPGQIVLDQIRSIDKRRVIKKLGQINVDIQNRVLETLNKIFSR